MRINQLPLQGLQLIEPNVFDDERGFFLEYYNTRRYGDCGFCETFVQDNFSHSVYGTLRGLHYQIKKPQGKLVSVVQGIVFDVAVDIRPESPTFGKHFSILLSDKNHYQLYIPPGFAHGFYTVSETADFLYKCTEYYDPTDEGSVLWSDPKLAIKWPSTKVKLSKKDSLAPLLDFRFFKT